MAPVRPAAISRGRSRGTAKRGREHESAASDGRHKRQKTAAAGTAPFEADAAARRSTVRWPSARRPSGNSPPVLSQRPSQPLDIYVLGANSGGELGLGPSVKSGNVARPRLNPYLSGPAAGIVQVSLGAMHGVALTLDNRILTWGVNDHGALGRDTSWEGRLVDADASDGGDSDGGDGDSDSGDDDGELNPRESTPTPVDVSAVPPDTVFTQVAAADNATFALTSTGSVYGWGTFRSEDGKLAFTPTVHVQPRPALIPHIGGVTKICCGSNHVMALTADGSVYTWGRGTDGQLGRRFSSRVVDWAKEGLVPRRVPGLKDVVDIGCGSNHSFAIERAGTVYGWGFNNAGQIGAVGHAGDYESAYDFAITLTTPTRVRSLEGAPRVTQITGGSFHTLAVTEDGRCLAWGRLYSFATGLKIDALPPRHVIRDSRDKPSFLRVPAVVPGIVPSFVAAASEHSLAVAADGRLYTWGLNLTRQIGHEEEEVEVPTVLHDPLSADKRVVWAGAGAQYSMFGTLASASSA